MYHLRMTKLSSFPYFKTSPDIIRLQVMLYVHFPRSLRNVEDLLHERVIPLVGSAKWAAGCFSLASMTASSKVGELSGLIFAIERYNTIKRSYLTEPYDIFCLQRPGFMVEILWDASRIYGVSSKGQVEVELINMGMIECQHGRDLHEMGNVRQGNGGTEWAAIYNDEFLVRFTARQAVITYSDDGEPSISALAHPIYCEDVGEECRIYMKLPTY